MSAPRPGNQERGWNDPPLFDYQGSSALQASPRRTNLNKRVAYPAMTGTSSSQENPTGALLNPANGPPKLDVKILPPTSSAETPCLVPLIVPSLLSPTIASSESSSCAKKEEITLSTNLEDVLERLHVHSEEELMECVVCSLNDGLEKCTSALTTRAAEDVKRKIELLSLQWKNKELSTPVKCRMGNLAEALKKSEYQDAWNIHQTLIVDYTSEVNMWLVGVKRIIHELLKESEKVEEISNSDSSTNSVQESQEPLKYTVSNDEESTNEMNASNTNISANQIAEEETVN